MASRPCSSAAEEAGHPEEDLGKSDEGGGAGDDAGGPANMLEPCGGGGADCDDCAGCEPNGF